MEKTTTIGVKRHAMHLRLTVSATISSCGGKNKTAVANHMNHISTGTKVGPSYTATPGDVTPKIHRKRIPRSRCIHTFCSQTVTATSYLFALTRMCMHRLTCRQRHNKNMKQVLFNYPLTCEDTSLVFADYDYKVK